MSPDPENDLQRFGVMGGAIGVSDSLFEVLKAKTGIGVETVWLKLLGGYGLKELSAKQKWPWWVRDLGIGFVLAGVGDLARTYIAPQIGGALGQPAFGQPLVTYPPSAPGTPVPEVLSAGAMVGTFEGNIRDLAEQESQGSIPYYGK